MSFVQLEQFPSLVSLSAEQDDASTSFLLPPVSPRVSPGSGPQPTALSVL